MAINRIYNLTHANIDVHSVSHSQNLGVALLWVEMYFVFTKNVQKCLVITSFKSTAWLTLENMFKIKIKNTFVSTNL